MVLEDRVEGVERLDEVDRWTVMTGWTRWTICRGLTDWDRMVGGQVGVGGQVRQTGQDEGGQVL